MVKKQKGKTSMKRTVDVRCKICGNEFKYYKREGHQPTQKAKTICRKCGGGTTRASKEEIPATVRRQTR